MAHVWPNKEEYKSEKSLKCSEVYLTLLLEFKARVMFLKISNQKGKESFDNEKKNDRKKKSILNLECGVLNSFQKLKQNNKRQKRNNIR